MSDLEKFVGKGKAAPKADEAPAVQSVEPSVLEKLLQALVDANVQKGKHSPEHEAALVEADRMSKAAPNIDMSDRVWIILSDNKNIPRGGQFFGINGASFLLKAGKKAHVPRGIVDVLDNAIEGVGIIDPDTLQIVEYRQVQRYPYQIVRGE